MKFFTVATAALVVFAGMVAAEETEAAQVVKRACTTAPKGCVCNKVQGQFCGIASPCVVGHVYECNGSTGAACDYGPRDSCKKCNKLVC
ncbi:hypothetical protein BDZ94DRAFT_1272170 [Collybia nuda]|uniref:Uncharacterized protein n=1 Tax=Collybia nuda TaxID=64659 RepID=A0A9P6C9Y0_9AGAR|nr:hypothetical protein BDZ94DRAFT_1272170 [Collybia nuda]